MKKLSYLLSIVLLSSLLGSCEKDKQNQTTISGTWKITKINSKTYANKVVTSETNYENDHIGEIIMLNKDVNHGNNCYLSLDTTIQIVFDEPFDATASSPAGFNYYTARWGTNENSLKSIDFYAADDSDWTVAIEDRKFEKQKWVYVAFDVNGSVIAVEEIYLKKK